MNHTLKNHKYIISPLVAGITLLAVLFIFASPAMAADPVKGKTLHDQKCFGCHDTRQYTRKNRIIHTFEDLEGRVEFCDAASKAGFTPEDIEDVVAYLNKEFYKFKQ